MTRPSTHIEAIPEDRCENCKFSALVAYKRDLLCFHGDKAEVTGVLESGECFVELEGRDVSDLEGDEYDRVWAGRAVSDTDSCAEWEPV